VQAVEARAAEIDAAAQPEQPATANASEKSPGEDFIALPDLGGDSDTPAAQASKPSSSDKRGKKRAADWTAEDGDAAEEGSLPWAKASARICSPLLRLHSGLLCLALPCCSVCCIFLSISSSIVLCDEPI
jgi:hypothetical protein